MHDQSWWFSRRCPRRLDGQQNTGLGYLQVGVPQGWKRKSKDALSDMIKIHFDCDDWFAGIRFGWLFLRTISFLFIICNLGTGNLLIVAFRSEGRWITIR